MEASKMAIIRPQIVPSQPSKAIICLHGSGSSGPIFRIQLAKLRLALKDDFEFIFATAPTPSIAGPGMLPLFAGAGPFYRWFSPTTHSNKSVIRDIHEAIRTSIDVWETTRKGSSIEIVGIIGFSQGAVAPTLLMWQQQNGEHLWLPKLRFGVFICSDLNTEILDPLDEQARTQGGAEPVLLAPTLHVHGLRDPYLKKGRSMLRIYKADVMELMEFDGGHHCPTTPRDCATLSTAIRAMADKGTKEDLSEA
jgi:hypothetical protein